MSLVRAIGLGVVLLAFWLVLSGHFEPKLIAFGIGSTALVVYLSHRMRVVDEEGAPFHMGLRFFVYLPWLMKEIFVSNVKVAKIILSPRLPINPVMVLYHGTETSDVGRVLYANSITLTPGTITTHVDGNELEVHSLTWMDVDGREEDAMDRWVRWVEQGGKR